MLRDADAEEVDALKIIDDSIENLLPSGTDKQRCTEVVWQLHTTAEDLERASRRIEALRDEVWTPFERRAKVLSVFGYLDYDAEKVTERGRWLADLHIDRPLLVGEALESGLFNSLERKQLAGIMAALTADEDRDYGELELNDDMLDALSRFEEISFKVSNEEWKYGLDPAPDGSGTLMLEGKMQDDATFKQCKVMVTLAELLAKRDENLKKLYEL